MDLTRIKIIQPAKIIWYLISPIAPLRDVKMESLPGQNNPSIVIDETKQIKIENPLNVGNGHASGCDSDNLSRQIKI